MVIGLVDFGPFAKLQVTPPQELMDLRNVILPPDSLVADRYSEIETKFDRLAEIYLYNAQVTTGLKVSIVCLVMSMILFGLYAGLVKRKYKIANICGALEEYV